MRCVRARVVKLNFKLNYSSMSYFNDFDIFVGGKTGIFKGVKIDAKTCIKKNIQSLMAITADHEITALNWRNDEEKEILIACGAKEVRSVKVYDTEYLTFTNSFNCNIGNGAINGIFQYDDGIITSVESGHVTLWKDNEKEQLLLNAGENLHRMRRSDFDKNIIATGGRENEIKLFDLEKQKRVFIGKNVGHDWLELRVPIWISDICFLPNTSQVVTISKYGHVRLYDPAVQRRPVINLEIKDEALTALAVSSKEMHVIVGSGKGRMNLIDLRKPGRILNTYKDFTGGITNLACSKTQPLVVSVGLDRYLRIHHLDTKNLIRREYLTSRLNCLLLRSNFSLKEDNEVSDKNVNKNNIVEKTPNDADETADVKCLDEDVDSETEYDAIFDNMQVIANEENEANLLKNKRKRPLKKAIESPKTDSTMKKVKRSKLKKNFKKSINR